MTTVIFKKIINLDSAQVNIPHKEWLKLVGPNSKRNGRWIAEVRITLIEESIL